MSDLSNAIKQVCEEKNLDYDSVVTTIELALAAAYRKDYGEKNQNIKVVFDPNTGKSEIYDVKIVVEDLPEEEEQEMRRRLYDPTYKKEITEDKEVLEGEEKEKKFNPKTDIQLKEAMILKHNAQIGDELMTELPIPDSYGRMAAQTAKQVIIQKLREMERDMILNEFKDKEREVVGGVVQRREGRLVFVDLGKAIGILPAEEQIFNEYYRPGERIKVFIKEVRDSGKGPEIILSRRSEEILKKVFYLEIPEIANGLVEIKGVAREAGSRSKVAIYTEAENVDPVGSCVGQRGARIQTIISELGGEKIDIIEYSEDPVRYITNSLAPAKILNLELNEEEHKAVVKVSSDKLSLAIGKSGQNVRLAARLTGWKIDIIEASAEGEKKIADSETGIESTEEEKPQEDLSIEGESLAQDQNPDASTQEDKKSSKTSDKKSAKKKITKKDDSKEDKKSADKSTKKIKIKK